MKYKFSAVFCLGIMVAFLISFHSATNNTAKHFLLFNDFLNNVSEKSPQHINIYQKHPVRCISRENSFYIYNKDSIVSKIDIMLHLSILFLTKNTIQFEYFNKETSLLTIAYPPYYRWKIYYGMVEGVVVITRIEEEVNLNRLKECLKNEDQIVVF
jgi:hypothetical protein